MSVLGISCLKYNITAVIHNMNVWDDQDAVKSYAAKKLSLNEIEVVRTKTVMSGNKLVFAELKNNGHRIQILQHKHLLRHIKLRTQTAKPIYIYPAKSPEIMKTERNMSKIISIIPGASQNLAMSARGVIVERKTLSPTPLNRTSTIDFVTTIIYYHTIMAHVEHNNMHKPRQNRQPSTTFN